MLSSQHHQTVSKDAMRAGFPLKITSVQGEITLKNLLKTFKHPIECAQSCVTTYTLLNFLYMVVPETLWQHYSQVAYPRKPVQPGGNPPYHGANTTLHNHMI